MTGMELLAGLSFVDERFIAEADTATLGRKIPWMKILSVAACLCVLIVGAFALDNIGYKGAMEEAAPAAPAAAPEAAPEAVPEAAPEAAPPMPESAEAEPEAAPEAAPIPVGELQHVPHATLRIVKVLDDGSFEAIAEATEPMEMDTRVTVVVDPSKVPGAEGTVVDTIGVVEGARIEVEDGAYDPENNILYVAGWQLCEGE